MLSSMVGLGLVWICGLVKVEITLGFSEGWGG